MELQYVLFNVWLLSLNKLLVRFAHMGVYLSFILFIKVYESTEWIYHVYPVTCQ